MKPVKVNQIKTKKNKLNVCIPTYNGAKYIAESITSILSQTYTEFELIIVDDCSIDSTERMIKSFNDNRIKYFRNPVRLGLVGNWNRCIELSTGQYICIFHQDDVMMPDNLAEKIRILEKNPNVGMVHSNVLQIGPKGELIREGWVVNSPFHHKGFITGLKFFKTLLLGPNFVSCPSVMVRRACYENIGSFDSRLPFSTDWEMWLRLALFYDIGYLNDPLIKYRWHENNETLNFRGVKDLEHAYRAKMLILDKHPELLPNVGKLRDKVMEMYKQQTLDHILHHHRLREHDKAKQYLAFALEIHAKEEQTSRKDNVDWFLEIVDQMWQQDLGAYPPPRSTQSEAEKTGHPFSYQPIYRQIVDNLSGEDIAQQIPIRKLIKAVGFKIGTKPGFRWLYRYRNVGKKILG